MAGLRLEDINRRGQKVIDAVYNLVNKGYNGTETPISNDILSVNSVGNLSADGNYFTQTYSVGSKTEMSTYTIVSLNNLPEGTKTTDVNGNDKTIFNSGEQFKVAIPRSSINGNINGTITVKSRCKTFPIFFADGPAGYQDYAICTDPFSDVNATATLSATANTGKIQINKTDSDTSKPVSGVTFQLTAEDGTVIGKATTDGNGKAYFENLYPGNYRLQEVSTNSNYVLNNAVFEVNVEFDKTTVKNITNDRKKGQIKVIKIDKDNKEVRISGVEFAVMDEKGNILEKITTNSNGEATTKEYAIMDFEKLTLKEVKTGENYVLNNTPQTVVLKEGQIVNVTFENEKKKGKIKVIKIDLDNKEVKIPNVEFKIYDKNNNVVETLTTNSEGEATSKDLPIDQNYKVQETKTGKWYVLNEVPQTAVLKQDEITTLVFTNEKKKGRIKVVKIDEDYNEIKLQGVEFTIYDESGAVVEKIITDKDGQATSKLLPIDQEYTVKETKTQQTYILNETPQKVTLKQDQISTLTFSNEKKKGALKLFKVDADNHKITIGNVEFDLYSEEFQKVIGTYRTSVDGEIEVKDLRVGNYKWIEKITNKWYNLAEDTNVEVEWNKNNPVTIENELKKGSVKIIKVDKDNNEVRLSNVKFDVIDETGKTLETIVTDENGEAVTSEYAVRDFEKLTLKEVETQEDYKLNEETKTIVLEENQIKTITFENELKKGKVRVIKVDKDNNEVLLKDVKFNILNEKNEIVDTLVTDEKGEATSKDLPIREKYKVVEVETKKEYKLSEETQTVELKEDEITSIKFENELKKGKIRVIKVDKDNNEVLLQGVKFEIKDQSGKVVDTVVTNEKGEATTKPLPCINKKYVVVEVETKKEYVLTEETQTVELKEDEITNIKFENEKVKGYIEINKVSADDNKLTGDKKGTRLKNAEFEIYSEADELVDTIITDDEGKGKSKLLEYGKYYITEKNPGSDYYLLNTEKYDVEITENLVTIPVTIENTSVDVELDVDKTGIIQAQAGDEIRYDFNTVANNSNVAIDNFTLTDDLPFEYIDATKLFTGIYSDEVSINVSYKTNMSEDYILYKENLSSKENNYIDFEGIELQEGEYITNFKMEFGTVPANFKAETTPFMFAKVKSTVKGSDKWTNEVKLTGTFLDRTLEDKAEWTTISYEKKLEIKKLPKTGM